jgi:hypothetical protein
MRDTLKNYTIYSRSQCCVIINWNRSRVMKKRRHWIEEGNYSVLYGTACRVIVEDKANSRMFVLCLWLLMHEAHVSMYYDNKS